MEKISSNNRRIALNTFYLYIRKVIIIFIALYTSRLVLKALGVDDFGLYGLVGSVVLLFSSLRGIFSSSVQRFITVSLSNDNPFETRKVFSIGLRIHIYIALIFFTVCEGIGAIILPSLNIPPASLVNAEWVLLFSVLTASVTLITVPFDAIIIAHEKLNVYALISIFQHILRFGIVLALFIFPNGRIVLYSILILCEALITISINCIYCTKKFGKLVKYIHVKDKQTTLAMTKFAGWNLFGNIGYSLTNSGSNFILNIFGGVAVNAARGIAGQVMTNVQQFINDLSTSFQPQAMIAYSKHEMSKFYILMFTNSKLAFYIFSILGFPLVTFALPTLRLWLGEVPEYSVIFTQLILLYSMVRCFHTPIDMIFKTEARLKEYQLTEFSIFILNLPVSYFALKFGAPFYSIFLIMTILEVINLIAILLLAQRFFGFNLMDYLKNVMLRIFPFALILALSYFIISQKINQDPGTIATLFYLIGGVLYATLLGFFFIFNRSERKKIISIIKR